MRSLIPLFAMSLFAPVAALADDSPAAPAPGAAPAPAPAPTAPATIATTGVPATCRPHARFANSAIRPIAMRARLALAQCLVAPALAPIDSLLDSQESMSKLATAVAPSLALYDDVIAFGDPAKQVLAAHAKGELYEELLARMANTVPPSPGASGTALDASRQQLLDVLLDPWRAEAATAFARAVTLAKAHPAAAKHPIARAAVAKSQQRVAAAAQAPAPAPTPTPTPDPAVDANAASTPPTKAAAASP